MAVEKHYFLKRLADTESNLKSEKRTANVVDLFDSFANLIILKSKQSTSLFFHFKQAKKQKKTNDVTFTKKNISQPIL